MGFSERLLGLDSESHNAAAETAKSASIDCRSLGSAMLDCSYGSYVAADVGQIETRRTALKNKLMFYIFKH